MGSTSKNNYRYIEECKKYRKKISENKKNHSPKYNNSQNNCLFKNRSSSFLTKVNVNIKNEKPDKFKLLKEKSGNEEKEHKQGNKSNKLFSSFNNIFNIGQVNKNSQMDIKNGKLINGDNHCLNRNSNNSRNIKVNNLEKKKKCVTFSLNYNENNKNASLSKSNENNSPEHGILHNKSSENNEFKQDNKKTNNNEKKEIKDSEERKLSIVDIPEPDTLKGKKLIEDLKKNKNMTNKECSYFILTKSPVLRLCERMKFSRSTQSIREILSIPDILNEHEKILQEKIEELQNKINLCEKTIKTPFSASKTADITLNFITSSHEEEFEEISKIIVNENEKKNYYNYIKIVYLLFDEEFDSKNEKSLKKNLYDKIKNKGFKSIRDYLYNIYIKKKDFKAIKNIEEINELIKEVPELLNINNPIKICKFISFTAYLIKEIIDYANLLKSTFELKIKTQSLLDMVRNKLESFQNRYKDNNQKK